MKPFVLSFVVLTLFASCATYRLQPVDQGRVARDGVTVQAFALQTSDLRFDVTVKNETGRTLTVDSDQFRLYTGDNKTWTPHRVLSSAEAYARAEQRARLSPTVVAVTTRDAPVYRQTTTTIGGGGTSTVTRIERRPSSTQIYVVAPDREEPLARFKESLFFTAVLQDGQSRTGVVLAEPSRGPFFKLVVPVEGKDIEIVFERVKIPGPFINLN